MFEENQKLESKINVFTGNMFSGWSLNLEHKTSIEKTQLSFLVGTTFSLDRPISHISVESRYGEKMHGPFISAQASIFHDSETNNLMPLATINLGFRIQPFKRYYQEFTLGASTRDKDIFPGFRFGIEL